MDNKEGFGSKLFSSTIGCAML